MTETYRPGQRSPHSGRFAHAEPPNTLSREELGFLDRLDNLQPVTYSLVELAKFLTRPEPGGPAPVDGGTSTALQRSLLAAIEYRGGGLTAGSRRGKLDVAAVTLGTASARVAFDRLVADTLRSLEGPATVRTIQRRLRADLASTAMICGALDRLRMAGTVEWLNTDPIPWGTWNLVSEQRAAEAAAEQRRLDEAVAKMDAMVAEAYGLSDEEMAEWGPPSPRPDAGTRPRIEGARSSAVLVDEPVELTEQQRAAADAVVVQCGWSTSDPAAWGPPPSLQQAMEAAAGHRPQWEPPVDAQQWREAGDALERQFRERTPRDWDPRRLATPQQQGLADEVVAAAHSGLLWSEPTQVPDPAAFRREREQAPEPGA